MQDGEAVTDAWPARRTHYMAAVGLVYGRSMAGPDDERTLRRAGWRLMHRAAFASRGWVAIGVAASLLWVAAKIALPLMTRNAIDAGIEGDETDTLVRWIVAILGATVVAAASSAMRRYAAFALSLRAETDIRTRLFSHLQGLHFGYHDTAEIGDLMARANLDLRQIQNLLVFIPLFGANLVMVAGITVVLFALDAQLAVVALAALPFLSIAARRFSTRIHPVATALQGELSGVSQTVEESVAGVRVVKGFGAEEVQNAKLADGADRVYEQGMALARLRAAFIPLLELLPTIGLIAVLWFGGHRVIDGQLTVGELVAFNYYIVLMIFPLRMTSFIVAQFSRATVSAARVYEVLGTDPEIRETAHPRPLTDGPGTVRFDDVAFGYRDGPMVLDGLDLEIVGGESVAVVGGTGSGKSTISRLLPRYYDVGRGRITLDGIDVRQLALGDLRRAVGMVFEDTFLFTDTIGANIAFARPDATRREIERAARLAGAHEFVAELPEGYDSLLGEQGYSLSGGQRQRIAIARAIIADPRVLVLDDATSAVDPTKEQEIRAALDEVMAGRTTIIIAHRPATIALADRVVVLDGGRIVDTGSHDEVLARSPR